MRPSICAQGDRNRGAQEETSRRSAEMDDDDDDDGSQHLKNYTAQVRYKKLHRFI